MNGLLILLGAHYIGDFPLQGSFLADMKGKRWYILFSHALIYSFTVSIALMYIGKYADWKFTAIMLTHMIIDKWKSSQPRDDKHWNLIYIDQALHIAINALMIL